MKISVVIPLWNRPLMSVKAVQSVLSQSRAAFELIVVNDGSTSDMSEVRKLVESAGGYYLEQKNSGVASARNLGVARARGDWLSFLDSDDYWLPEKLAAQVRFLKENPEYRICQTEEKWIRRGKSVSQRKIHQKPSGDAFARSLELCCLSPSSVLLEKRLFEEHGGFDEAMRVCEDYDLWLRITANHQVGYIEERHVVKHGGHPDQLSHSEPAMDRFRIYSMVKLLLEHSLDVEQELLVFKEIQKKAEVLCLGAKKRGNSEVFNAFMAISQSAKAARIEEFREWFEVLKLYLVEFPGVDSLPQQEALR